MRKIFILLIFLLLFSCGKEKIVQLPEIKHSNISEINDVSAAYIFYDETMPDNVELNRKNLIISTNWLVNVDKRLTLGQAIPKIMFLQDKKRNTEMHKNENARNYFTCNNSSIKNLGFIEFTDVIYHEKDSKAFLSKNKPISDQLIKIKVHTLDSTLVSFITNDTSYSHTSNQKDLLKHLENSLINKGDAVIISELNKTLSFQDYITYKSLLLQIGLKNVTIANDEFVFN